MTTGFFGRIQFATRAIGASRLLLAIIIYCWLSTTLRADGFGYRFSPLATPEMYPVALYSDPEALPERGLLYLEPETAAGVDSTTYYSGIVYALDGTRIGLTDEAHTSPTGVQISQVGGYGGLYSPPGPNPVDFNYENTRGQVIGLSAGSSGDERLGSAWLYDPFERTTTRLGYFDGAPVTTGSSNVLAINDGGQVIGTSQYPFGSQGAWLYRSDSKEYKALGLFRERLWDVGASLVSNNPSTLDDAGNVSGVTIVERTTVGIVRTIEWRAWYHAANELEARLLVVNDPLDEVSVPSISGRTHQGNILGGVHNYATQESSLFIYDPGADTTTFIRAADDEQAWDDGTTRLAWANAVTFSARIPGAMPYAVGYFARYRDGSIAGQSAWIYDQNSGARRRIGPTSAEHGVADGREFTGIVDSNATRIVGTSRSFGSDGYQGNTVWIYDVTSAVSREIGLDGAEVRRADGIVTNRVMQVRKDGLIVGTAELTLGENSYRGTAAWIFDPATGQSNKYGLYGADVWQEGGTIATTIHDTNDAGYVLGRSDFTHGADATHGKAAWLYDPASGETRRIGFYGDGFRQPSGRESAEGGILGTGGHVVGSSTLDAPRSVPCIPPTPPGHVNFCDRVQFGVTWMYDPYTDETVEIDGTKLISPTAALNLREIKHVNEDGAVFGVCNILRYWHDAVDQTRACMWTREEGIVDLSELVGPKVPGWDPAVLQSIDAVNSAGLLVGTMKIGNTSFPYTLTPVPEPGAVGFASSIAGLLVVLSLRRRGLLCAKGAHDEPLPKVA